MDKQLFHREVRLGSASNFETFLTVRELSTPADTVELKFETVFSGASASELVRPLAPNQTLPRQRRVTRHCQTRP